MSVHVSMFNFRKMTLKYLTSAKIFRLGKYFSTHDKNMVEAQGTGSSQPRAAPMVDEGDSLSSERLQWTAQLVSNVDKKLRASISVDELKKLCL